MYGPSLYYTFLFGLAGFIYKKLVFGSKSILGTILYDEIVFNALIKSTRIFLFNLFYNSIMFLIVTSDPELTF
jgi:hypothetical protein